MTLISEKTVKTNSVLCIVYHFSIILLIYVRSHIYDDCMYDKVLAVDGDDDNSIK